MRQFKWKPSDVFYGWWIVTACSAIMFLLGGFVMLSFTAFFEPIAEEFNWSYAQISLGSAIRGVEVGLLAPLVGILVDRWGPRWLIFMGIVLIGSGLIALSYTMSLGAYYGAFVLMALGSSGASPTVMMTAVATWFRRKVGIATGIVASGFALGGLLIPVVVKLIDIFDWRNALLMLGLLMLVINLPLSLIFRHKPEQYGYQPDGDRNNLVNTNEGTKSIQPHEADINATQALKSRAFWHIGLGTAFQFLALIAVTVHVMPYLSSVGIIRSTSSFVAMSIPLISIIGRLSSGWLVDRFNKKQVATVFFSLTTLGMLIFSYVSSDLLWLIVFFVIIFGIGWGGNATIRVALVRNYFGRSKFGSIYGLTMGLIALGGIAGPLFAGWVYDNLGSYRVAWLIFTGIAFAGMIMISTTPSLNVKEQTG